MSVDIVAGLWMLVCRERDSNPHGHHWPRDFKSLVSTNSTIAASVCFSGAENGTRTRDPDLGKVVLYQLSYFRMALCGCKGRINSRNGQIIWVNYELGILNWELGP